jgi:hypothetical protein
MRVNTVRFSPGVRTAWHAHAVGQTLYVTEGIGLIQSRGGEVIEIRPGIGPFICAGRATGAGGANVTTYADLRQDLAGSEAALPGLPDGIGMSLSFRRATRSGPNEGLPIEDVGVEGTPYAMTRDDLLFDNRDLVAACIEDLRNQPFSRLSPAVDTAARTIQVTTAGLDRIDMLVDGHPGTSQPIEGTTPVDLSYPAGAGTIELTGFAGAEVRQRRRLLVGA